MGLGQFVNLDRDDDFIGKAALTKIAAEGPRRRRVGLVLEGEGIGAVPHPGDLYLDGNAVGSVAEAVYSPRLKQNIAIALISSDIPDNQQGLEADLGADIGTGISIGRRAATIAALPFC